MHHRGTEGTEENCFMATSGKPATPNPLRALCASVVQSLLKG